MPACPFCAESIRASAEICPYCKSNVLEQPYIARKSSADDPAMRMLLPVGRSGWAIAAGYLGLFSLTIFLAPIALIVSIVAIIHLRKNPKLHGMGRAIFGLVMGGLGTLFILFFLVTMLLVDMK